MRLSKLDLIAYGPFRGLAIDFSRPALHVVLGRNEAGKSTTLRAITGLLYGIDPKTPDAHVHKFGDLRIGGVLENAEGERIRVVRRKGNSNTLLGDDERPIDESVMRKLCGGVSKETFTSAYGLDHDTLEAGARALLEGKGDLGESLFDAGVGGGGEVQRLLAELVGEADRIYKPRATALPLNEALRSFADAQKSVRERESRPEAFVAQEEALVAANAERAKAIAAKSELEVRRRRFENARRRVPLERRLERAIAAEAQVRLPAGQAGRALALRDRFAGYQHATEQRRGHLAEGERVNERIVLAARHAGVDPALFRGPNERADALRLDTRSEARVHALLEERTRLLERLDVARTETALAERELARLEEGEPDGTKSTAARDAPLWDDTSIVGLESAVERARRLGDIEERLAPVRSKVERQGQKLVGRAAAIAKGLFEGSLEELVALRLPAVATVQRLEELATELARRTLRIEERVVDLEREAASNERQIASSTGDFAPPDAASLSEARERRDRAWNELRTEADPKQRSEKSVAVERLLRAADDLADRMIREADRVTLLARLRSEAETGARHLERARAEKAQAVRERTILDAELARLFVDARVRTLGFAEMAEWIGAHAQLVDAWSSLEEARADVAAEEAKVANAKQDLVLALGLDPAAQRERTLAELVHETDKRIKVSITRRQARDETLRRIAELRAKLGDRAVLRSTDEADLAVVEDKIAVLLGPLGIARGASTEEITRSIEALRELFSLVEKRADAEVRMRVVEADIRAFEDDLGRMLAELAPDLAQSPPLDAVPALIERATLVVEAERERANVLALLAELPRDSVEDEHAAVLADPDAAARAEEELRERLEELERETSRLTESIGAIGLGLQQMRADSNAAEAATTAQYALSRIRENAERWSRVKLAHVLLAREIERYREENQAPLLASSSELFARLTLGSFAGIKAGFDDKDRPSLKCLRADGTTEVDVSGLSDGTRDQLYLSLRLASLLRRSAIASMPLVLDDVLIQLDDQRAAAALGVLAEVSRKMQVLFFTHHARLVELARETVPSADLVVHELATPSTLRSPDPIPVTDP